MRTVLLILLTILGLAACGDDEGGDGPYPEHDAAPEPHQRDAGTPPAPKPGGAGGRGGTGGSGPTGGTSNPCNADPCSHGTCQETGKTTYVCKCDAGWSGATCSSRKNDCADNPCDHGACLDYGDGYECVCKPGWSGARCTVNEDDCKGVTQCGSHGACVDSIGGYTCSCRSGWTGALCDQDVDDCAHNPCQNGGTCVDGVNSFTCECDEQNWTGQSCEIDVDSCAGNYACGAHGTCVDEESDYECVCAANWYGSDCSLKTDYCIGNDCQHGSTCVVSADSFTCDCPAGWEGTRCEQKIDPCSRCTSGQVCEANACVKGVLVPDVRSLGMDATGDAITQAKLQMPKMPDFTDKDVPLGEHGFVLVQDAVDPTVRVLDQNPAPGTLVAEGTAVALRVAIPPDDQRFLQDPITSNDDSEKTAQAYYKTIDPDNTRNTLSKWIDANGFNDPKAETAQAIYQNTVDLGFVRDMHMAKRNGRVAFYVKNHQNFGDFRSGNKPIATVAMEYGITNSSAKPFVTFYTFKTDGTRVTQINLDGQGDKAQPGVCLTCHGGFSGASLPKPGETMYPNGGDTGARFIPFDLSLLAYENNSELGSTRAAQEDAFRQMNLAIADSYGTTDAPHAKDLVEGWYAAGPTFNDDFVPAGWTNEVDLYNTVVKPNCRLCHSQQNRARDFASSDAFLLLKEPIRTHIFERSSMPLARRTFYDFWVSYPNAPTALAAKIGGHPQDGTPVTGHFTLEFAETQTALVEDPPLKISPSKAAFVDTIDYTLSVGDPNLYRLTPVAGSLDLSFEIVGTVNSSDLVTINYSARGRSGATKSGSFQVAVTPTNKKLSFFADGIVNTWKNLPCGGCHVEKGPGEHAYIFEQSDDTIKDCLTNPTGATCSQTFVSKLIPGDGNNSRIIRVPLDRPNVAFLGSQKPHPLPVDATLTTNLQTLEKWIDDGALP